jgi:hypothetical protein
MVLSSKLRPHLLVWLRGLKLFWRCSYSRHHCFESWPLSSVVLKKGFVVSCGPTGKYHVVFYNTWSAFVHSLTDPLLCRQTGELRSSQPCSNRTRRRQSSSCNITTQKTWPQSMFLLFIPILYFYVSFFQIDAFANFQDPCMYVFHMTSILLSRWRGESLCL